MIADQPPDGASHLNGRPLAAQGQSASDAQRRRRQTSPQGYVLPPVAGGCVEQPRCAEYRCRRFAAPAVASAKPRPPRRRRKDPSVRSSQPTRARANDQRRRRRFGMYRARREQREIRPRPARPGHPTNAAANHQPKPLQRSTRQAILFFGDAGYQRRDGSLAPFRRDFVGLSCSEPDAKSGDGINCEAPCSFPNPTVATYNGFIRASQASVLRKRL